MPTNAMMIFASSTSLLRREFSIDPPSVFSFIAPHFLQCSVKAGCRACRVAVNRSRGCNPLYQAGFKQALRNVPAVPSWCANNPSPHPPAELTVILAQPDQVPFAPAPASSRDCWRLIALDSGSLYSGRSILLLHNKSSTILTYCSYLRKM